MSNENIKLMIVDDSMVVRRIIRRSSLVKNMSAIIQASNGAEALIKYNEFKPNLVSMDLTMPQMDGVECVQRLIAINPSIRILVISAMKDKSTALQAIKCGARGFLAKPFTEAQLNKALSIILNRQNKTHD